MSLLGHSFTNRPTSGGGRVSRSESPLRLDTPNQNQAGGRESGLCVCVCVLLRAFGSLRQTHLIVIVLRFSSVVLHNHQKKGTLQKHKHTHTLGWRIRCPHSRQVLCLKTRLVTASASAGSRLPTFVGQHKVPKFASLPHTCSSPKCIFKVHWGRDLDSECATLDRPADAVPGPSVEPNMTGRCT